MNINKYNKAKETLYYIWYLEPSVEQIVKCLKLMNQSLCEDWGFLPKREILTKTVNDTTLLGLSKTKIRQLLLWEEN